MTECGCTPSDTRKFLVRSPRFHTKVDATTGERRFARRCAYSENGPEVLLTSLQRRHAMNRSCSCFFQFGVSLSLLIITAGGIFGAEPKVRIRSRKNGSTSC